MNSGQDYSDGVNFTAEISAKLKNAAKGGYLTIGIDQLTHDALELHPHAKPGNHIDIVADASEMDGRNWKHPVIKLGRTLTHFSQTVQLPVVRNTTQATDEKCRIDCGCGTVVNAGQGRKRHRGPAVTVWSIVR